eukprot:6212081-Pleurochrysis_carterae.AAC.3
MTDQLPLPSWLSISAFSARSQAGESEDMACFSLFAGFRGSVVGTAAKAQPVDLPLTWRCAREGLVRSAAVDEERRLSAPSCRWKCCGTRAASKSSCREAQSSGVESTTGSVAGSRAAVPEASCDAVGSLVTVGSEEGAMGSSSKALMASPCGAEFRGADAPASCAGGKHELTARESSRFKFGGYAALSREDQLPHHFWPPTCLEWVECVQCRAPRCDREPAMEGVQRRGLNFWAGAPRAHCGKVIGVEECAAAMPATSG